MNLSELQNLKFKSTWSIWEHFVQQQNQDKEKDWKQTKD